MSDFAATAMQEADTTMHVASGVLKCMLCGTFCPLDSEIWTCRWEH